MIVYFDKLDRNYSMAKILHLRMTNVMYRNDFIYQFTKLAREERAVLKILHGFTDKVIVDRRKQLLENLNNDEEEDGDGVGIKKKMALLDVLLRSTIDGKPLTNEDIQEEVDTFMFEGHDTTTSGIIFGLFCLGKYPEVQKKVLQEIHDVLGDDPSAPSTLQKLNDMPYLDATIKEILRLFSPVPLVGRLLEEDLTIGKYTVPKGTSLVLGLMFMHQDPDLFPEPKEFRPERFMTDRSVEKANPYSYIPFSAGSRNCIGQKFAILEMKSMLSKLVRNFEIAVDASYKEPLLAVELVSKPQNGVVLNFKKRV